MSKIVATPELFIEETEVNRLRELLEDKGFRLMFSLVSESFGIIKKASDTDFNALKVTASSGGYIGLKAGYAIDSKGQLIANESDIAQVIQVEVDNPDQYVYISYNTTNIEKGTVSIAQNGNVTGSSTEFTKIFKAGKSIEIINSSNGNNGIYEIKTVSGDTACSINGTFPAAESGLHFKVVGTFTPNVSIPEGNKRPYFYDTFTLAIESSSTNGTNDKFLLAKVNNSGSSVSVTDMRTGSIHYFKKSIPEVLSAAYTTNTTFKVGGADGRFVLTEPETPALVQNFRIVSIDSTKLTNVHASMANSIASIFKTGIDSYMDVKLKWGWDDITGNGGNGTFTINNSGYTFTLDQLKGLYLYIPTVDKNLKITGNAATSAGLTVLSVEEEGGLAWDGTLIELKDNNKGWIHFDADSYEIVALPLAGDPSIPSYEYTSRIEAISSFGDRVVRMECNMRLHIGKYYLIKICAKKGTVYNDYVDLPAGSFTQYATPQNYDKPCLIKHPSIPDDGQITVTTSLNGFNVVVDANVWQNADSFEVAYTSENTTADFGNQSHNPTHMAGRRISITTNASAEFNVSVRPLISGQAVAPAKTAKVVSGSAGRAPDEKLIATINFDKITFSGTLTYNTSAIGMVVISNSSLETPASSGRPTSALPDSLIGSIITIGSVDYRIIGRENSTTFEIEPIGAGSLPASGTYEFTIGVSKLAREVYNQTLFTSTIFTRAEVDPKYVSKGGALIRIYDSAKEENADHVDVYQTDTTIPQALNLKMIVGESTMKLKVDLYDPDGGTNSEYFMGRINIFGREYVDMTTGPVPQV